MTPAGGNGSSEPVVGVLALQGDFAEHEAALARCGLATRLVRTAGALAGLHGLVLPGGESTTMLKLLEVEGMFEPLARALASGIPVLATCAGMILLADRVESPVDAERPFQQRSFGLLPITVVRNGYGRQLYSGTFLLDSESLPAETHGTFIRAPRITHVGDDVSVMARREGDPVLVEFGHITAACFHPELEYRHPVVQQFAERIRGSAAGGLDEAQILMKPART